MTALRSTLTSNRVGLEPCDRCHGSGHDKGGRPETHFEEVTLNGEKKARLHITDKQGSGCLKCLGKGHE